MKQFNMILITLAISISFPSCNAQSTFGTDKLEQLKTIPMPEVKGRVDHMDINLKDQIVYVAAIGNNSVEVADLHEGKITHTIKGLDEPQGVGYISQYDEIFVTNGGNGDCYFYDAKTFKKVATIHLSADADDVRYDSADRKIYVGYGTGGIAVIDAGSHKQVGDIRLPAHPESFQIDKKLNLLFVNIPDAGMVGVVDLKQMKLTSKWIKDFPRANFPMAIDANNHRVFVGYRHSAKLVIYDGKTGIDINETSMVGDADDIYFDDVTGMIIISGGEGYINAFRLDNQKDIQEIANISTSSGARTSLLIPQLRLFVLACRANGGRNASLQIYKLTR
jgi:hypothetical protein